MKINLKKEFTDQEGKPIKDAKEEIIFINRFFSNILFSSNHPELGEPVKVHKWSLDLWDSGEIDTTDKDRELLIKFITDNSTMTVGIKAQLINAINTI